MFDTHTFFFPAKGKKNRNTWANGNETRERQIDYIAAPNEHRKWVANVQTKGVENPDSPLQRKTIKINIKYDIISTNAKQ